MSRYPINTIEHHRAELDRHDSEHSRRNDYDVADVGLSQWASSAMIDYHYRAIEALELGQQNGFDGPATKVIALYDRERRVNAELVEGNWGWQWRLSLTEAERYGRRYLPTGKLTARKNSRILRKLGLYEREIVVLGSRFLTARTAGIGCAFSFILEERR